MLALTLEVDTVGGKVTREIRRLQVAIKRHIALLMLPAAQKHNGHKGHKVHKGPGAQAGADRAQGWTDLLLHFGPL
jgi:hypothetical protein